MEIQFLLRNWHTFTGLLPNPWFFFIFFSRLCNENGKNRKEKKTHEKPPPGLNVVFLAIMLFISSRCSRSFPTELLSYAPKKFRELFLFFFERMLTFFPPTLTLYFASAHSGDWLIVPVSSKGHLSRPTKLVIWSRQSGTGRGCLGLLGSPPNLRHQVICT